MDNSVDKNYSGVIFWGQTPLFFAINVYLSVGDCSKQIGMNQWLKVFSYPTWEASVSAGPSH